MGKRLPKIESEFDTPEDAAAYHAWLQKKLQKSLEDPRPSISHDVVMGEIRDRLAKLKASQNARGKLAA
jgi:hypothetical protein